MKNLLTAADGAIWANRAGDLRAMIFRKEVAGALAHGFRAGAIGTIQNLANDGPTNCEFFDQAAPRKYTTDLRLDEPSKPVGPTIQDYFTGDAGATAGAED